MMNKTHICLFFLLFFPLLTLAESSVIPLFDSRYELSRDGTTIGEMTRSLSQQGQQYIFKSESNTTGLVALFYQDHMKEETRWQMQGETFQPLEYHYFRERKDKKRQVDIQFDWQSKRIITNVNGSDWNMPIEENIFDKLLYQIAIMLRLNNGQNIDQFKVADGGKIKTYSFKNLGKERLSTPMGEFNAVKLERSKSNNKKKLTFWCAEELGYLPIKVENIDKEGKTVIAIIKSYAAK